MRFDWRACVAIVALASSAGAAAQGSFDVLVGRTGGALTVDFFSHGGTPPAGGASVDLATGHKLFPADFGDFPGGPRSTDDPGFQGFAGTFVSGDLVYARGLGSLEYWAPGAGWSAPPAGEIIRLFGGIPTDVAIAYLFCQSGDPFLCDPGLAAQYPFYAQGTAFGAGSITGPNPTIIDEANASGAFHAHLDWFVEAPGGTPAIGAYLLTLQLTMNGGRYADSPPFKILFNHGLAAAQFQEAVLSRVQGGGPSAQVPLGPAALVVLGALLALVGARSAARR